MKDLGQKIMIFDGGMGSEIVKSGVNYTIPEDLNITHPELIKSIHRSYKDADFITTNSFGLNKFKYKGSYSIALVAQKAIENARESGKNVFFDIGPTGMLLKPMGTLSFDDAYNAFRDIVLCTRDNVDGYIIETFSDLYELKAAVLAVKENSEKPLFATMTFDKSGRTLTGTTPEIMVRFLESAGVDALGVNCSLGPKELKSVIERILSCTHTPVLIQPNRGIPRLVNGESVYDLTKEEFTEQIEQFAQNGVSVIGGCCGTTPEFIESISKFKGLSVKKFQNGHKNAYCSYSRLVEADSQATVAELNISEDITADECEDVAYEVLDLEDEGADAVKLIASRVSPEVIKALIEKIQEMSNIPLLIDSNDEMIVGVFKRYYNGVC